jgi:cytidylate kinase
LADDSNLYRGRLAPSPTGLLHVGHARTFWTAAQRAADHGGQLILRNEDLDHQRCRPEFVEAMIEDLRWLGISWTEGPDCGGPHAPYTQCERRSFYLEAWRRLRDGGWIYPCTCSRKDVAQAAAAPNDADDEPLYSGKCRPHSVPPLPQSARQEWGTRSAENPAGVNWRFRVPDGEEITFTDPNLGPQRFTAGTDFGDFIVWRRDDVPAYQLAVVVDDAAMRITEVVRGADLLKSTARQILLYRALGLTPPDFYHCDLVRDEAGVRLAKRHDALSIRKLREMGATPGQVRAGVYNLASAMNDHPSASPAPRKLIIAIDGPAGAGKSTLASRLARKLGYVNLESGAMYRALALLAIENDTSFDDEAALVGLAEGARIQLEPTVGGNRTLLNGVDVSSRIRERDVTEGASRVSVHPKVREWMVAHQRAMGAGGGVVMEGRDIGTKVFPDADLKIFLDADPVVREQRRMVQQNIAGEVAANVAAELRERDRRDRTRAASPLVAAADAVTINSSAMTEDEVLARVEQLADERMRP